MNGFLIFTFLLMGVFQASAQSFEPGLWKSKESLELNGVALPEFKAEECISANQAKDAKATIEKELGRSGCSLTKWAAKDRKLNAAIDCKNENFEAVGTLNGEFTSKSYNLNGTANGSFKQMLPATVVLKLSGQWVKICPKK